MNNGHTNLDDFNKKKRIYKNMKYIKNININFNNWDNIIEPKYKIFGYDYYDDNNIILYDKEELIKYFKSYKLNINITVDDNSIHIKFDKIIDQELMKKMNIEINNIILNDMEYILFNNKLHIYANKSFIEY